MRTKGQATKDVPKNILRNAIYGWTHINGKSSFELAGEILAKAQLIEELMRVYIAQNINKTPTEIDGTFGNLEDKFQKIYPESTTLLDRLDNAKDVRNDIAHHVFLVSWFMEELSLEDHYSNNGKINRLNHRVFAKGLYVMDECLHEFRVFLKENSLKDY